MCRSYAVLLNLVFISCGRQSGRKHGPLWCYRVKVKKVSVSPAKPQTTAPTRPLTLQQWKDQLEEQTKSVFVRLASQTKPRPLLTENPSIFGTGVLPGNRKMLCFRFLQK